MDPGSSYLNLKGEPVVTLYVGNDREVFRIHRNLLCNASPVFKAAFAGNFRESSELSMELTDEDVDSLNQHLQARHWQLARLYALADKYDIVTLRNDIVDKFFAILSAPEAGYPQYPSPDLVEYVYTNSSKRCALRDLLAAVFCWKVPHSRLSRVGVKDYLEGVPALAADIVLAMAQKLLGNGDPFKGKASNYYENVSHEDPNGDQDEALV